MLPIKNLEQTLKKLASQKHYLFTLDNLRAVFPQQSANAYKSLMARAVKGGLLTRVCRGVYLYANNQPSDGLVLYHTAALLRASEFNYISLESALSDAGVISQIPLNWITLMSSGRSSKINCGKWGTIEFIHTKRKAGHLQHQLSYDTRCHLWRANTSLALQDMKLTQRNNDLIDWELANELI